MKRACFSGDSRGFTLLEVIVTLVVAGILATMLVQFMGANLARSVYPVVNVQNAYAAEGIMENMVADHKKLLVEDSTPLATFRSRVGSGYYGTYAVEHNDYMTFVNGLETPGGSTLLKVSISVGDQKFTALFAK